jgi:outer membrane receptor protein involved in Fe transport
MASFSSLLLPPVRFSCVNFDDARLSGVEFNTRARFNDSFSATGNFTYIRAHGLLNGLPPNIEGGIPPATSFVSLRYQPRTRFYIEGYQHRQTTESTFVVDLGDRRTGAARSRKHPKLLPAGEPRSRSNDSG